MCPSRLPNAHECEATPECSSRAWLDARCPWTSLTTSHGSSNLRASRRRASGFGRATGSSCRCCASTSPTRRRCSSSESAPATSSPESATRSRVFGSSGATSTKKGWSFARQRLPDVEFARLDARALPYHDEFDVVGAFDVLEHVEDDSLILENVWRALRPGGGTILLVPQHPRLWSEADVMANHVRRYVRRDLVAKVRAAGFDPVRVTSFVTTLLPAMAVSRRGPYDPIRALVPGRLNRIFEAMLDAERKLIERGISLPVGGSLLVIGRKPPADPGR